MKSAFVKIYDHAEDNGHDKINQHWDALEALDDDDHDNRRKIIMAEFDRLGHDEEYKAHWLAGYNRQNGLDGHVPTREPCSACTPS